MWTPEGTREIATRVSRIENLYAALDHWGSVWPLDAEEPHDVSSLFLDVDALEVYRLPAVRPIPYSLGRRFLAVDANGKRLFDVDLDASRVVPLGKLSGCPASGELDSFHERGPRVAITCRDEEGSFRWSEVIDVEEGWRTRTDKKVEAITPDGRIVVSNTTSRSEEPRHAKKKTTLWWLELGDACTPVKDAPARTKPRTSAAASTRR